MEEEQVECATTTKRQEVVCFVDWMTGTPSRMIASDRTSSFGGLEAKRGLGTLR
ncbi:hypothetical protein RE6C_05487 [Rhodopirellula europaea 6C]|uniref:Uncharacterized protein n=1 Tax=Rhodopirellula europaea 6C TaxID=1263867 RepID=M2AUZ9_9BACT|nr:hypothetical protein RE6C_05487 [Rhodopirellula europaea 6C]